MPLDQLQAPPVDTPLRSDLAVTDIAATPGLPELWQQTQGDARVCVAILDGAVDLAHPSLAGAHIETLGAKTDLAASGPAAEHGTHVASVVFGNHGGPVQGIAPGCRGLIVPVFKNRGDGGIAGCSQKDLAEAIRNAIDAGADVINISAGQLSDPGQAVQALHEAIRLCEQKNRLIVAAAGNDGCAECLHVPGAVRSPSILAVGAMDGDGRPLDLSNWGEVYRSQGLLAPGKSIRGAIPGAGTSVRTGTSFATAIVAGIAGLLLSLQIKRGICPNPQAVRAALLESVTPCKVQNGVDCNRQLAGRLDITKAISLLFRPPGVLTMSQDLRDRANDLPPVGLQPTEISGAIDQFEIGAGQLKTANDVAMAPSHESVIGSRPSVRTAVAARDNGVTPFAQDYATVNPSGCGGNGGCSCGKGARQLVYVIGEKLDYDFGTRIHEQSLQENFTSGILDIGLRQDSLRSPVNMLRHLLGWDGRTGVSGGSTAVQGFNGNLYDVKSVHWVLFQDDCPKYVIRPEGVFADVAYKALLYFFVENAGIRLNEHGIAYECLDGFFKCHGGLSEPLEGAGTGASESSSATAEEPRSRSHKRSRSETAAAEGEANPNTPTESQPTSFDFGSLLGEPPGRVARIGIAGQIIGQAQLSTGEVVDVINPELRGMASWNTERLLEEITRLAADDAAARVVVGRIASTLYEETRNDGKLPEDRAKNWAATGMVRVIRAFLANPVFAGMLGGLANAAVSGIDVTPGSCQRTGLEYDVDVSLYSFENTLRSELVLTTTVDVSEVVPVTLGQVRASTKR